MNSKVCAVIQVMLDSDVAMLYHYETKNINKAMKRNKDRFPEDFCFQLTNERDRKLEVPKWNFKLSVKSCFEVAICDLFIYLTFQF